MYIFLNFQSAWEDTTALDPFVYFHFPDPTGPITILPFRAAGFKNVAALETAERFLSLLQFS